VILRKPYRFFRPIILVCATLVFSFIPISRTSNAHEYHKTAQIDIRTEYRTVKIGVLAKRGVERCQEKWGPTADYLTENIPGYSFEIRPLKFDEVNAAVEKAEVDFVLANSSIYVELEYYYGASRILTLNNLRMGEGYAEFGGVIFCRVDRKDLKHLEDLKGISFMAVDEKSFGGWRMAWRELKEHGIDPYDDFTDLNFGGTHDAVVYAVRDGKVDAGTVRTDALERMAAEGKINLENYFVLHEHIASEGHMPFMHSTRSYPEWPLAKVKHTSNKLAERVAAALLEMTPDNPAAKAAKCVGWTIPHHYRSVHECLKYLRVGPYKDYGKVTLQDALRQYWFQLVCGFIVMCLIVVYIFRVVRLNRRLKESEQKVRIAFDQTFQLMGLLDCDGTLLEVNQTATEFAGIEEIDVLGKPFWETIWWTHSAELQNKLRDAVKKAASGQFMRFEVSHVAHDGTTHCVDFSLKPVKVESGEVIHLVAEGHDITERKQAEEALRKSDSQNRLLIENAHESIISTDSDGKLLLLNKAAAAFLGGVPEDYVGKTVWDIFPKETADARMAENLVVIQSGNSLTKEHSLPFQGKMHWFLTSRKAIRSASGEMSVLSIAKDITERKEAEEALKESEHRYQELFNSIMEGISIVDEKEIIKYVNPAFVEIFGEKSANDMLEKNLLDYFSEKQKYIIRSENDKRRTGDSSQYELEITTTGGREKHLFVSITPRFNENNVFVGAIGSVIDVTETKRLQALESRAERLETAGTIAGQVAHDFNNLLSPIMAYPEFIHEELPHDHKAHAYLDIIEEAAQKMADINQDLLTMGRRGHYNQDVINLNRIVLHAAREMESRTKTVTCELDLCEDLMKIKGGEAQIHRMLANLLVNAQDAMEDIGQITIKTENYYADDTSIAFGRVPKGEYVKLTVSDNGGGVPDDIIQKILDPFFSTKTTDKKRGSGLGLSVVDAVMRDHNGHLDLSSKVGHGTSFYLYFPVTIEDAIEDKAEHLAGGTEMVLVVDDDDMLREVSSQLLTRLGYRVSSVGSGEEAVEFLREKPQDLMILDMVMPGLNSQTKCNTCIRCCYGKKI